MGELVSVSDPNPGWDEVTVAEGVVGPAEGLPKPLGRLDGVGAHRLPETPGAASGELSKPRPREREEALPMTLTGGPVSAQAKALVETLLVDVIIPSMETAPRPSSVPKLNRALGALLSELFDLQRGHPKKGHILAGAHGMSPGHYPHPMTYVFTSPTAPIRLVGYSITIAVDLRPIPRLPGAQRMFSEVHWPIIYGFQVWQVVLSPKVVSEPKRTVPQTARKVLKID